MIRRRLSRDLEARLRSRIGAVSAEARSAPDEQAFADEGCCVESAVPARTVPQGPSLKARAIGYLSRREYSRVELVRKLRVYAESEQEVDAVLDALVRDNWLSDQRFTASLVHRRAERFGARRIVQELKTHQISEDEVAQAWEQLLSSELARAYAAWQKKFDRFPADVRERAKQIRFLLSRGFASEIVAKVVGGAVPEDFGGGAE